MADRPSLTTAEATLVGDNQNAATASPAAPAAPHDQLLLEKLAQRSRDRSTERVMHAKGVGAHGTLTITQDITRFTRARLFSRVGKATPVLARFSTVAGGDGAAAADREVRGFSLKFYSEEGNWDLVGNNSPVFFVRDPAKFPEFIQTQRRDPKTGRRSAAALWDFWSRSPETLHQVTMLMSDRGLPASPRFMNGYGSHTYSFWNSAGARFWVKFHFKTQQGCRTPDAGARTSDQDELGDAIAAGDFPKWTMYVQIMPEADAEKAGTNPFDLTKVWPHAAFPLHEVGVVELNRNPDNIFNEIEQAAFSPSNVVPGIGFSPDKMLQARIFAYADAHRHRLGAHYESLPVNAPKLAALHPHTERAMRLSGGGAPAPAATPEPELRAPAAAARTAPRHGDDDFTQAGNLFRLLDDAQRQRLFANIAAALDGVPAEIIECQVDHFRRADPAYADGVVRALLGAGVAVTS